MNEGFGQWIYSFHIPIFFIISGILFYQKNELKYSKKEFLIRKLKTILFPYISISLINILYSIITSIAHNNFTISTVLNELLSTLSFNGILALWFLPTLFLSETLCYLFLHYLNGRVMIISVSIILTILTSVLLAGIIDQTNGSIPSYLNQLLNIFTRALIGFIFLLFGYFLPFVFTRINISHWLLLTLGVIFLCINFILYRFNKVDLHFSIIGNPILYYTNALCGSIGVLIISYFIGGHSKIISFWGKNSLIIFSTHLNFNLIGHSNKIFSFIGIDNIILTLLTVLIIETLIILLVNKFFPFIINYYAFANLLKNRKFSS